MHRKYKDAKHWLRPLFLLFRRMVKFSEEEINSFVQSTRYYNFFQMPDIIDWVFSKQKTR